MMLVVHLRSEGPTPRRKALAQRHLGIENAPMSAGRVPRSSGFSPWLLGVAGDAHVERWQSWCGGGAAELEDAAERSLSPRRAAGSPQVFSAAGFDGRFRHGFERRSQRSVCCRLWQAWLRQARSRPRSLVVGLVVGRHLRSLFHGGLGCRTWPRFSGRGFFLRHAVSPQAWRHAGLAAGLAAVVSPRLGSRRRSRLGLPPSPPA